jgi:hypothetical protein
MTAEEFTASHDNVRNLTLVFHASYEKSGDSLADMERTRIKYAEEWYKFFVR